MKYMAMCAQISPNRQPFLYIINIIARISAVDQFLLVEVILAQRTPANPLH